LLRSKIVIVRIRLTVNPAKVQNTLSLRASYSYIVTYL